MTGTISRRCSCRNPATSKIHGSSCPKLTDPGHGTWTLAIDLARHSDGRRRNLRRGGYAHPAHAQDDLGRITALLALAADVPQRLAISDLIQSSVRAQEPLPDYEEVRQRLTGGKDLTAVPDIATWLHRWLAGRRSLRPNTLRRYTADITNHLIPHLGHIPLDQLRVHHLDAMFAAINKANSAITENNALRRTALDELSVIPWRGAEHRDRRRALKSQIEAMPPFADPPAEPPSGTSGPF